MDRSADQPLTVDIAKERLRKAGAGVGVRPWIRRHPMQTLIIAASSGFVAGRVPKLRNTATFTLIGQLMKALL